MNSLVSQIGKPFHVRMQCKPAFLEYSEIMHISLGAYHGRDMKCGKADDYSRFNRMSFFLPE